MIWIKEHKIKKRNVVIGCLICLGIYCLTLIILLVISNISWDTNKPNSDNYDLMNEKKGDKTPDLFRFIIDTRLPEPKDSTQYFNKIGGSGNHIELDIGYSEYNNFTLNWGDGSSVSYISSNINRSTFNKLIMHDYDTTNVYTITINGMLPGGIRFGRYNDPIYEGEYRLIEVLDPLPCINNSAYGTFIDCVNLAKIPSELFEKNTHWSTFFNTFSNCTSLADIPEGLFDKNIKAQAFVSVFFNCSSLKSIPQGLFDNNTQVEYFSSIFAGCVKLIRIPTGIFDKNTLVTNFDDAFSNCISLENIPQGIFDKNTHVTSFRSTFANCNSLTSIPMGLFDNNVLVTSFENAFSRCSSLKNIPEGLFNNNPLAAETLSRVF